MQLAGHAGYFPRTREELQWEATLAALPAVIPLYLTAAPGIIGGDQGKINIDTRGMIGMASAIGQEVARSFEQHLAKHKPPAEVVQS